MPTHHRSRRLLVQRKHRPLVRPVGELALVQQLRHPRRRRRQPPRRPALRVRNVDHQLPQRHPEAEALGQLRAAPLVRGPASDCVRPCRVEALGQLVRQHRQQHHRDAGVGVPDIHRVVQHAVERRLLLVGAARLARPPLRKLLGAIALTVSKEHHQGRWLYRSGGPVARRASTVKTRICDRCRQSGCVGSEAHGCGGASHEMSPPPCCCTTET